MTSYKLLAVDVDGTLSRPGERIPDVVVESLRTCLRSDIFVVLATGKRFCDVRSLCERVGIDAPVIACNGALIVDAKTLTTLSSHFLSEDSSSAVVSDLDSDGCVSVAMFTPTDIVCRSASLASRMLSSIGEQTTYYVDSLLPVCSNDVVKVLGAVDSREMLKSVYDFYSVRYSQECSVTMTGDTFIEFMAPNVSKGNALLWVARRLGVAMESVACIGDSDNDLSMFKAAGLAIAVANATPSVLEAADVVVLSASQCGVVNAVNLVIRGIDGTAP